MALSSMHLPLASCGFERSRWRDFGEILFSFPFPFSFHFKNFFFHSILFFSLVSPFLFLSLFSVERFRRLGLFCHFGSLPGEQRQGRKGQCPTFTSLFSLTHTHTFTLTHSHTPHTHHACTHLLRHTNTLQKHTQTHTTEIHKHTLSTQTHTTHAQTYLPTQIHILRRHTQIHSHTTHRHTPLHTQSHTQTYTTHAQIHLPTQTHTSHNPMGKDQTNALTGPGSVFSGVLPHRHIVRGTMGSCVSLVGTSVVRCRKQHFLSALEN